MKNNTDSVLKAKQESFRLLNEESNKNRKLIDDQQLVIKNLKAKLEVLEEESSESRANLQKRLDQKDTELQIKIATFEANLHEAKQYFEEMLNDKENHLKEKNTEIKQLKDKINSLLNNSSLNFENNYDNDDNIKLETKIKNDKNKENSPINNIGSISNIPNELSLLSSPEKKINLTKESIESYNDNNISFESEKKQVLGKV